MKEYCFHCDYDTPLELRTKKVTRIVRNKSYEVTMEYYECPSCNESFIVSGLHDMFTEAFDKYRSFHNMVSPEFFKKYMMDNNLSCDSMDKLLNFKNGTSERFINGGLLTSEQDNVIKLWIEKV